MKDFEFSLPTKIIFGQHVQEQVGELSAAIGQRALIMYGSSRVIDCGLMEQITASLKARGVAYRLFGGISPNPLLSQARKAASAAKAFGADLILAVGGGSVIDAAKAAALGAKAGPEMATKADPDADSDGLWEIYTGKRKAMAALPVGVVLTMAATASEANSVSVLRNDADGKKAALTCPLTYPAFALLNPELTYSVPAKETAIGALDIFSHAFERYFHREQWGTLRNYLCEAVMKTVIAELPRAQKEPECYEARSQLMWAATVAHSDMIGKEGVYVCHAMSHVLTAAFGMPHGMALAVLMPAWCKYVMVKNPGDIAGFAARVWGVECGGQNPDSTAQEGIFRFQQFICNSGLPVTLREAGINNADSAMLTRMLMDSQSYIGENYEKFYQKDIQAMFDLAIG